MLQHLNDIVNTPMEYESRVNIKCSNIQAHSAWGHCLSLVSTTQRNTSSYHTHYWGPRLLNLTARHGLFLYLKNKIDSATQAFLEFENFFFIFYIELERNIMVRGGV